MTFFWTSFSSFHFGFSQFVSRSITGQGQLGTKMDNSFPHSFSGQSFESMAFVFWQKKWAQTTLSDGEERPMKSRGWIRTVEILILQISAGLLLYGQLKPDCTAKLSIKSTIFNLEQDIYQFTILQSVNNSLNFNKLILKNSNVR